MHWDGRGILLSVKKHGEHAAVLHALTAHHGLHAGVSRAAYSKKSRGIYQPGNIVHVTWKARLAEHIGAMSCEMLDPVAAVAMGDKLKLAMLTSACALVEKSLPEREPHPRLHHDLEALLLHLKENEGGQAQYVRFEMQLLADTGFGLDLTRCAATGAEEGLIYVSPKTGRAVSAGAGEPYRNKLLPLPKFLSNPQETAVFPQEILDGMRLTGYFLEKHLFAPHGKLLPAARGRLMERVRLMSGGYHG